MMSLLILLSAVLCVYTVNVNASILGGATRLKERNKLTNSVSDLRYHFSASSNHNNQEQEPPQFNLIHNRTHSYSEDDCSNQTRPFDNISCLSIMINGSTTAYNDVIKCINNVTHIMRAYWIGYRNLNSDQVVVGFCKFCNSFYSTHLGRYVPLDVTNQCLTNRDNRLCSCCINKKAPAVNSRNYTCIECNAKNIGEYFAYNIIGLFILLAFIFIFNFFPGSGALNPLVFFAQMITTTLRLDCAGTIPITNVFGNTSNADNILQYTSDFVYGIWNLDFTNPANSFCFAKSFQTIHVLAINYFVAALPLIPVFVLALLARCLDKLQNKCERTCKQIFNEDCVHYFCCNCLRTFPWLQKMVRFQKWRSIKTLVASCLLLSYTKFAVTTIYLITPTHLYDENGTVAEKVLYYQGNLKYFGPKHKKLGLLAIFFLVTFVIGFPLLLLLLRYKSHKDIQESRGEDQLCNNKEPSIYKHFDDFLQTCLLKPFQRDLKWGKRNSRPCVGFKIWRFSFGIHDCRWYAGWYFILRFSLFAAYILPMNFVEQLLLQQVLCTVMLIISLVLQPYRHKYYNRLDSFIFILISIINISVFFQYYRMTNHLPLNKPTYIVQYILVFIPQVLIILYFFAKLVTNYSNHDDTARDEELEVSEITPLSSATQNRTLAALNNQRFKPHFLCDCYVRDNERQEENTRVEEQQRPQNYRASINTVHVPLASDQ